MMNAFQRLRQTIDKVNIQYQFPEDNTQIPEKDSMYPQNTRNVNYQQTVAASSDELQKMRLLCENQQTTHLKQIHLLSSRVEELTKALKRAQNAIESYMNDIVTLQKQNDLLKQNLNQQYSNVVLTDDRERKYKQEIYRLNVTVNELATEINSERSSKKQLLKEVEGGKTEINRTNTEMQQLKKQFDLQKFKIESELQERVSMYEYNVKKNAQDRQQYRTALLKMQEKHEQVVNDLQSKSEWVTRDLFQARTQVEILTLRKQNLEDNNVRISKELEQNSAKYQKLLFDFNQLKNTFDNTVKQNESLKQSLSSLEVQLLNEKRNIKVKVVQVRDKTIEMELEIYRRQCREFMQQRAVMSSLAERDFASTYQIVPGEIIQKP